jgi:hypothetical protein
MSVIEYGHIIQPELYFFNERINLIRLLLQQKNSHPPFWRMAIPITVVDDYF